MFVVYGGTSSGKSNIAENIAVDIARANHKDLYYIATMESESNAAKKRIEHHKKMRDGKGFVTIEEMYDPASHRNELKGSVVLIECVSNLVANIYYARSKGLVFDPEQIEELAYTICDRIVSLGTYTDLIVVSNNVFHQGYYEDEWCDSYMRLLGRVNCLLADACHCFIEVNAGIAKVIKGER